MRILVIDDDTDAELAVAAVLRDTGHAVVGARDPGALPGLLAEEAHFDVAMVDMVFRDCAMTGLGALRILQDRSPGTKLIVRSGDEENRLLYLIAAFSFFGPLAMQSKGENPGGRRSCSSPRNQVRPWHRARIVTGCQVSRPPRSTRCFATRPT